MTILSSLRGRGPRALGSPEDPALPLTSSTLVQWLTGPGGHAGKAVTEQTALGMPAVWRAVNLIAGTGASLPLHAYRSAGVARVVQESGPEADLLALPHPDMTPYELWELGFASVALWGNAAYRKLRDQTGRLRELWWIEPSRVKYHRADASWVDKGVAPGTKLYIIDGDLDNALTDREILHIPGFGYDGVCGVSPIRAAREGIGLALAAEEYGAKLFGRGSLADGILTTDQRIDQEQADQLKARWKAGGTGLEGAHDIRVLGSGTSYQQLTIPPEDAQFIESRRFQIGEVARMFGIPPHMLGETERSTSWGTGIEEQNLGFVTYTLRPWLTRFEQRVSAMWPGTGVYARYSVEGLLRGNSTARGTFYRQLWELGVLSTNDIRALEELAPVDGGDARYRPLNFGPLGEADPATVPEPADGQDQAASAASTREAVRA